MQKTINHGDTAGTAKDKPFFIAVAFRRVAVVRFS
jgi:hypothetical protein